MKQMILLSTLFLLVGSHGYADDSAQRVAIELLDGQFEVLSGSIEVTSDGIVLRDATVRIHSGVIVSDDLGLTSDKARATAAEPFDVEALVTQIAACWNVGSLPSAALSKSIDVSFDLSRDAKPIAPTITAISENEDVGTAENALFESARRAILRCGARGFDLPAEKYEQWKTVRLTFNPEKMRIK